MSTYIVAYGGERLDRIAQKLLQTELGGTVEALLSGNPGLALLARDGFVPAGTVLIVPALVAPIPAARQVIAWE